MSVVGGELQAVEKKQEAALEQQRLAVAVPAVGRARGGGVAAFFEQVDARSQVGYVEPGVEEVEVFGAQPAGRPGSR